MRAIFLFSFIGAILFSSCSSSRRLPPTKPFAETPKGSTPDYSSLDAWSAHPDKADYADKTPPGVQPENQAEAKADVFYIHPTTFYESMNWNADIEDSELNQKTDEYAVLHHSSVFNRSCRVFAPRYRQMVYGGFFTPDTTSKREALAFAYQDIRNAFQYYLDHQNSGRPIVIAGHSQGSFLAQQLIKEFFDGKPLKNQLVAAYMPGWPFRATDFKTLPVCSSPEQNACVMGWNSWKNKHEPEGLNTFYKDAVVVNPINWKTDGSLAPTSEHKGYLNGKYSKIKSQNIFSQAHEGILWVRSPIPIAPVKNFHVGDINLFWLDIRENVALRVKHHLAENQQ